ncbi:hypothetical protein M422DRAFT_776836 [Sphaerobolus stellatus SS14]|nr:hypothetical protein M422DRAFT_776836 [Sphaerobolus stellatus SS14]
MKRATEELSSLSKNAKRSRPTRLEKDMAEAGDPNAFDDPDDPKQIGPWILGKTVGRGSTGRVKAAKHKLTGLDAAVKIIPFRYPLSKEEFTKAEKHNASMEREIALMKIMDHPNIIRLYDVWEGRGRIYLILEWVEGGELFDLIVEKDHFRTREVVAYFKQIICGLAYCHKFSIAHRDLKPENILVHGSLNQHVKIADWGMASFQSPFDQYLDTSCGSPHYVSPEVIVGRSYDGTMADVWSAGVVLYVMLARRLPFEDQDFKKLLAKVCAGKYEMPENLRPEAVDLLQRMLVVDVKQRITISEILKHPYLRHETPDIYCLSPPSLSDLQVPLRAVNEIDYESMCDLRVIYGKHIPEIALQYQLLQPGPSYAKAFYFLLMRFLERQLEISGRNGDVRDPNTGLEPYRPSKRTSCAHLPQYWVDYSAWPHSTRAPHFYADYDRYDGRYPSPLQARRPIPSLYSPNLSLGWAPYVLPFEQQSPQLPVGPLPTPIPRTIPLSPRRPHRRDTAPVAFTPIAGPSNSSPKNHSPNPSRPKPKRRGTAPGLGILQRSPPLECVALPNLTVTQLQVPSSTIPSDNTPSAPATSQIHLPSHMQRLPFKPVRKDSRVGHSEPSSPTHRTLNREDLLTPLTPIEYAERPISEDSKLHVLSEEEKTSVQNEGEAPFVVVSVQPQVASSPVRQRTRSDVGKRISTMLKATKTEQGNGLLQRTITKQDEVPGDDIQGRSLTRKNKLANLDLRKVSPTSSRGPSSDGSTSASGTTTPLLTPVVQEFRGWFSNMFHSAKKTPYTFCSSWDCERTKTEAFELLCALGVYVFHEHTGVLKCTQRDRYDHDGGVMIKFTRFRVEFYLYRVDPSTPFALTSGAQSFVSTVNFIHEKGSYSAFRTISERIKSQWRLEPLTQTAPPIVPNVFPVQPPPRVTESVSGFVLIDHAHGHSV